MVAVTSYQDDLHQKPMYLRLADLLAERIAKGWVEVGRTLPAEINLALEFSVSSGTMRKALDLLEERGIVSRRQGYGTFVCDPTEAPFKAVLAREQASALLALIEWANDNGKPTTNLAGLQQNLSQYIYKSS